MPYIERLLSYEVLLQPVPAPPKLQMLRASSHHSRRRRYHPKATLQIIFETPFLGFHYKVDTLSMILKELCRTNISASDNLLSYPRGQTIQ